MKYLRRILKWFLGTVLLIVAALYLFDYDYIIKGVRVVYMTGHTTAYIDDHPHFDNMSIPPSSNPEAWPQHKNYNSGEATKNLSNTNSELGTVAFLIIKNDSIWYENYADGYGVDSQTNSFSMAKSITSALLGKAIKDGFIKSLDQPISEFFEQYEDSQTTVGDLSSMASGLDWDESYTSPFSVTARAYYDDNLAETILNQKVVETPGQAFKYLSGNTELLGMAIEKATGKKLANYLSDAFWQPMGAEQEALWQVDDTEHQLVKSYCCIASNARDFARFGKLYKDHGKWNGQQLIDSTFVAQSVSARFEDSPQYGYGFWLSNHLDKELFVMRGILGQYVIVSPEDDVIIVRLGHQRGGTTGTSFSSDFYTYVEEAFVMLKATH
ncbi:MAG: CubicO group peptidase (beta-lactamase class C family) [Candidatus Latescibacterota bacterium]|jgi:CubicO group peptidase (beta-lactamase class C family)